MAVEAFAPAKVNLTLHVLGRRDDGYHLLDSLVVFAAVGDRITAVLAEDLSLTVTGPMARGIPVGPANLVLRAAALLRTRRDVTAGARLTLEKHLPHGAGLGGGSSDAAATLRALSRLWGVAPLAAEEAVALGADLPVCLQAPASSRMTGIGETVRPAPPLPRLWLVLVNPGVVVSTRDAFARLPRLERPAMQALPDPLSADAFALWLAAQRNDLTPTVARAVPAVSALLRDLAAQPGCVKADMSGSGSTCWGMFFGEAAAADAGRRLAGRDRWVRTTPIGG